VGLPENPGHDLPGTQADFYEPGKLETRNNQAVTVEQPCLLMVTDASAAPRVTIADRN
jgi:hypothetical protein